MIVLWERRERVLSIYLLRRERALSIHLLRRERALSIHLPPPPLP